MSPMKSRKVEPVYGFVSSVPFRDALPRIDQGVVKTIEYKTCNDDILNVVVVKPMTDKAIEGVLDDAWWRVDSPNLPRSVLSLDKGAKV